LTDVTPADPRFQVREHTWGLAEAEVAAPSNEVWREVFDQLQQADPPRPAGQVPDLRLEFVEGFCTLRAAEEVRAAQFGSAEGDLDVEMVAITRPISDSAPGHSTRAGTATAIKRHYGS
jgi:hypothetical protein